MLRAGENIKKKKRKIIKKREAKKSEKQKTKKIMSCHCRHRKNVISHNNEPRFWANKHRLEEVGQGVGGYCKVQAWGRVSRLTVAGANGAQLMTEGEPRIEASRERPKTRAKRRFYLV